MKLLLSLPLLLAGALTVALLGHSPSPAEAAAPAPAASLPAAPETFTVDPAHSTVLFRVRHLKTSLFYGRFNELEGQLILDENKPENSSVEVSVNAASVDTNDTKRDQHAMSPDFLDAKQFSVIHFASEKVSREGGVWKAEGPLTLHGVTRPVSFEFEKVGEGTGFRQEKIVGFHARFEIDRTDFGMDYSTEMLGKTIELTISLEAGAAE